MANVSRCRSPIAALLLTLCGAIIHHTSSTTSVALASDHVTPTQINLVAIHPHNVTAFTEGFFFMDGTIIESTGLARRSFIRQYHLSIPADVEAVISISTSDNDDDQDDDQGRGAGETTTTKTIALTASPKPGAAAPLSTGKILKEYQFDSEIFGEGIASIGDKIYALTYKQNKVLVLNKADLTLVGTHPFHTTTGEGWGMTTDGTLLIVSDGSSTIQFYDPHQNFKRVKTIEVILPETNKKVEQLNELEFVDGEILANVWFKNHILRIDPRDGRVIEQLDLSWIPAMVPNLNSMHDQHMRNEAVMNGIAFNPKNRHVYITGKLWDSIFELELSYLKHQPRRHHKSDV